MHNRPEDVKGPALGTRAPFFGEDCGENRISMDSFRGNWVILFSHPDDLIPVFKTRTIHYLLCKRRIKAIAVGRKFSPEAASFRNFIVRYLGNHSLTVINDTDGQIAKKYGLDSTGDGPPEKGVFVLDPQGILRMKLYLPLSAERNFAEILKLVDALQVSDRQHKKKQQPAGRKTFIIKWNSLLASNAGKKQ